jgi:hypothetical protein
MHSISTAKIFGLQQSAFVGPPKHGAPKTAMGARPIAKTSITSFAMQQNGYKSIKSSFGLNTS